MGTAGRRTNDFGQVSHQVDIRIAPCDGIPAGHVHWKLGLHEQKWETIKKNKAITHDNHSNASKLLIVSESRGTKLRQHKRLLLPDPWAWWLKRNILSTLLIKYFLQSNINSFNWTQKTWTSCVLLTAFHSVIKGNPLSLGLLWHVT